MPDTPFDSPSGEPAADSHQAPISPDDGRSRMVLTGLDKVDGTAMLELLRNDRVELAVELSPGDVQDSRNALERWWPW